MQYFHCNINIFITKLFTSSQTYIAAILDLNPDPLTALNAPKPSPPTSVLTSVVNKSNMADKVLSSEEFFDLFSTEYKENKDNIKGVGRGKLKEDISALKLPKAALVKKEESDNSSKSCFGRGRGTARMNVLMSNQPARLPKVKGSTKGYVGLHVGGIFGKI